MKKPRICAVVVDNDLEAIETASPLVDLFEIRVDLIGKNWQEVAKRLNRPWIACNRRPEEGGNWHGSDECRIEELLQAVELGADTVDIELDTEDLAKIILLVKHRARCLLSHHNLEKTPPFEELKKIVQRQMAAGADICKVVTTAQSFADNLTILQLIKGSTPAKIVSFAMGPLGQTSRILAPLAGADFTYASIEKGKESAQGQITVKELHRLYEIIAE